MDKKKILFVSGEVWPFVKTGGLGDVAYSLPKELQKLGADVRVILPKYDQIPWHYKKDMAHLGHKTMKLSWRQEYLGIEMLVLDGITYYFVDNMKYFSRTKVYGEGDDCERFSFFCKAVIESFDLTSFYPDIIHCNDWHTGMVPVYLDDHKRRGHFGNIKTMFTIHNLRFQGVFPYRDLQWTLGLDPNHYFFEEGVKFQDSISFMKGGVNYSNFITTVSPNYANEISTKFFGEGLEGLFMKHKSKLLGVVNGIDLDIFCPEKDVDIVKNFTLKTLGLKVDNKLALQKELGLEVHSELPMVSIITRLDRQKGIDLIMEVFPQMMEETNMQFVLLGNGEKTYEDFFKSMERKYPGRVASVIGFNNLMAKSIYASSDLFLMPSQFEPCGLSQLISMRYGTLPLVRETGGLLDTVTPFNEYNSKGTGFSFRNYNAHDMLHVIKYALNIYNHHGKVWETVMKNAMNHDSSWEVSAKKYLKLYTEM